jgi:NAD(P)-dependent dehydrogenase (short-subunit alcohol dehydrogenase family)
MLLQNKVAVIYGAGGAIGGAISRAFEAEGATLRNPGREVDALDERAVDEHLESVGRVDISVNAIGIPDAELLGTPFADLDPERFLRPIRAYTLSYFLTARLAARRMIANGSGVIMTLSALPGRIGTPVNGGYGPAQAAKDQLTRDLSAEFAPHGIRVVGLCPHGLPETDSLREVFAAKPRGFTYEQFEAQLAASTHPRRVQRVAEVANMAVFLASDRASAITGTTVNLTMGSAAD